jgi:hypothetical protein
VKRIVVAILALVLAVGTPAIATASVSDPSYAVVKRAVALMPRARTDLRISDSGPYDLENCQFGSDFIGTTKETTTGIYADVAHYVGIWEKDLPTIGYPERLWRPWVTHYEAVAVDTVRRYGAAKFYDRSDAALPSLNGLKSVLAAYRKSHPRLREIIDVGGCGGDDEPMTVVTKPLASQVVIIPTFYYDLCRVQRIDPDDQTRCNHWREVLDGSVAYVSGDYHYLVRWHDGSVRKGMLQFAGVGGQTVTLRKP